MRAIPVRRHSRRLFLEPVPVPGAVARFIAYARNEGFDQGASEDRPQGKVECERHRVRGVVTNKRIYGDCMRETRPRNRARACLCSPEEAVHGGNTSPRN